MTLRSLVGRFLMQSLQRRGAVNRARQPAKGLIGRLHLPPAMALIVIGTGEDRHKIAKDQTALNGAAGRGLAAQIQVVHSDTQLLARVVLAVYDDRVGNGLGRPGRADRVRAELAD